MRGRTLTRALGTLPDTVAQVHVVQVLGVRGLGQLAAVVEVLQRELDLRLGGLEALALRDLVGDEEVQQRLLGATFELVLGRPRLRQRAQ